MKEILQIFGNINDYFAESNIKFNLTPHKKIHFSFNSEILFLINNNFFGIIKHKDKYYSLFKIFIYKIIFIYELKI